MTRRAELIIRGQVVVAALAAGLEMAEAVAVADGRVLAVGRWDDLRSLAAPGARVVDAGDRAVIPGIHDFHIHLAALARSRHEVALGEAVDTHDVASLLAGVAGRSAPGAWIAGRGWTEAKLAAGTDLLERAVGDHPAFLSSHDGHSAWASSAARRLAAIEASTPDPPGGRIERDVDGAPTGILRETALELVAGHVSRLQGAELRGPLDQTLRALAAFGITGVTEAGDYTLENGIGADAALGDSYSSLTDLGELLDGRLRLTLGIPADGIALAADRGIRSGDPLPGFATIRFGWAKEYADGALGSGTAALLEPRTCGDGDGGILRVPADELDRLFGAARTAGIGMAVHTIGDRAVMEVLDAAERAAPRRPGTPNDRMEHVQLARSEDAERFGRLGVTASVQPVHAASDRDLVESCWDGRQDRAYAWRRLADAGALLTAGSDAPVESVDPWLGIFAAVHRTHPTDTRGDWRTEQALTVPEALSAYTLAPGRALGVTDEGHLRPGARADLAVLSVGVDDLLAAGDGLTGTRSTLTLVGGVEVPMADDPRA